MGDEFGRTLKILDALLIVRRRKMIAGSGNESQRWPPAGNASCAAFGLRFCAVPVVHTACRGHVPAATLLVRSARAAVAPRRVVPPLAVTSGNEYPPNGASAAGSYQQGRSARGQRHQRSRILITSGMDSISLVTSGVSLWSRFRTV